VALYVLESRSVRLFCTLSLLPPFFILLIHALHLVDDARFEAIITRGRRLFLEGRASSVGPGRGKLRFGLISTERNIVPFPRRRRQTTTIQTGIAGVTFEPLAAERSSRVDAR